MNWLALVLGYFAFLAAFLFVWSRALPAPVNHSRCLKRRQQLANNISDTDKSPLHGKGV